MKRSALFTILLLSLLIACKHSAPYIAIRDMRAELQPHLQAIANKGILTHGAAVDSIKSMAKPEELEQLANSENPVIRAVALRILVESPNTRNLQILFNHLGDDAMIATDEGEFALGYRKVADIMIRNAFFKDSAALKKTVHEIIMHHNTLESAYTASPFYSNTSYRLKLREMVSDDVRFGQKSPALLALAQLQDPEDTTLIKSQLMKDATDLDETAFYTITNFWHDSYFEVLELYESRLQTMLIFDKDPSIYENLFKALAPVKTAKGAALFEKIISGSKSLSCNVNTTRFMTSLRIAVWTNDCPAYKDLRQRFAPFLQKHQLHSTQETTLSGPHYRDFTTENGIRWPYY